MHACKFTIYIYIYIYIYIAVTTGCSMGFLTPVSRLHTSFDTSNPDIHLARFNAHQLRYAA